VGEPRVIKRYSNRKLYDTQSSRYVTLEQIADLIREGEDVRIVDNNSKEDLTGITLAQIIFEEEKKQKSFLPLAAMRNIIKSGGERLEELVTEAQKKVTDLFPRRKDTPGGVDEEQGRSEALPTPPESSPAEVTKEGSAKALREFREWLELSQRTIEEWQKKVDDRIHRVVEGISPFASLQKDVSTLATRIAELEAKLKAAQSEQMALLQDDEKAQR
jgi:polyhydroxyalkanoate synthesis repressor PhaR